MSDAVERIFCSFSMGRSSAYMSAILPKRYPKAEIIYGTANTGKEHPASLVFGDRCDKYFGLNLVWLEAVINEGRAGSTHRIIDFETASRNAEPFKEMIKKYGIPNMDFPHCTRELKLNPMLSYLRSIGWAPGTYHTAIGLRADEPKRFDKRAKEKKYLYALAEAGIKKPDVIDYWRGMPFDLEIEEHEGNCTTCWKKSDIKHVINIKQNPHWYDFNREMERGFGTLVPRSSEELAAHPHKFDPRVFFRKHRSTSDMFTLADAFDGVPDFRRLNRPDENAGCAESCEAFPAEDNENPLDALSDFD